MTAIACRRLRPSSAQCTHWLPPSPTERAGKFPPTCYRLTSLGRKRLAEYWQRMDEIRAAGQAGK